MVLRPKSFLRATVAGESNSQFAVRCLPESFQSSVASNCSAWSSVDGVVLSLIERFLLGVVNGTVDFGVSGFLGLFVLAEIIRPQRGALLPTPASHPSRLQGVNITPSRVTRVGYWPFQDRD